MLQVEGLMDDIDFKSKVTRAEFEELCSDLFERVPRPLLDALETADMKLVSPCEPVNGNIHLMLYSSRPVVFCVYVNDVPFSTNRRILSRSFWWAALLVSPKFRRFC